MTEESTLHDHTIYQVSAIAESLGYEVESLSPASKRGPDVLIRNPVSRQVLIVESEIGHNLGEDRYRKWEREASDYVTSGKAKAIIVITGTPRRAWKNCPPNLERRRSFFVVGGTVFENALPALLVKILG